jgi:enoyl-CoA hydratase/carnithine racemase
VYEQILYEVDDGVATITLNRPDRLNAINFEMVADLHDALDAVAADPSVKVAVLTGAGRGFCAGADLGSGGETFKRGGGTDGDPRDSGGRVTLRIFDLKKPVIAAVNGPAVGIGATVQLPMDIRIAAEDARFGFVFARRGIVPEAASSWFLPRVVGISQALDWALSGRVFPAQEALAGGLVKSLHPAAELLPAARALARDMADKNYAGLGARMPEMLG